LTFKRPVRRVRWQYQLQDGITQHGTADIAIRITDAGGEKERFAVVFEAKRKSGKLKRKDLTSPDRYLRLAHLSRFKRKFLVFLIDERDIAQFRWSLPNHSFVTWQQMARIQLEAFESLAMPDASKAHLLALLRRHLHWYGILDSAPDYAVAHEQIDEAQLNGVTRRLKALIRGAECVVRARDRLPLRPPTGFEFERSIEEYSRLKVKNDWGRLLW
jgi:hypothetical protein